MWYSERIAVDSPGEITKRVPCQFVISRVRQGSPCSPRYRAQARSLTVKQRSTDLVPCKGCRVLHADAWGFRGNRVLEFTPRRIRAPLRHIRRLDHWPSLARWNLSRSDFPQCNAVQYRTAYSRMQEKKDPPQLG